MAFFLLIVAKALPLFLTLDPLGNTGIVGTMMAKFEPHRQKSILRREVLIALVIMLFFYGLGAIFLNALDISQAAVELTGGFVFIMFSISLLMPRGTHEVQIKQEPFIVPIATPLMAGPSCLATIMLYSHESVSPWLATAAIFCAWLACTPFVLLSPLIMKIAGKVGLRVLEQTMGFLCAMIAIKMFLKGLSTFVATL